MNASANNSNDQWLIKSANRVMGPFKLTEVVTGLQLKHFTVMDEISAPFGRWILIRDELLLQAAVKEIRNRPDAVENTATLTQTMTLSASMSSSDKDLLEALSNGARGNKSKLDTLGAESSKKSWLGNAMGLIVVLGLLAGGYYFFMNRKKSKEMTQDGYTMALQLKNQGFYDRAFALMGKLKAADKTNAAMDLELGVYQIVLQNQNIVGRKNLDKILNQLDTKEGQATAYTAIGLSYLNENDFKNASEAMDKALSVNGSFLPALINKAVIDFKNGNPDLAEQGFEPLMNQTNNGVIVMGSTLASLEVNRKGLMPKRILPVLIQVLDDYLKNNFDFQQEAYVLKAYIYNTLGKSAQRDTEVLRLLNSDLESGQGHRFDLLVDRSFLNWKNLLPYCQTVVDANADDLLNRSLLAYCLSKAGSDLEAKRVILEAEAESPRHAHVAAIKAYIMKLLGQDSESQASLGVALAEKNILSAWLMKSKYCELGRNDACVQETLTQLMNINSRSLPAYVGMAKLELRRGNKKGAQDWVNRGQSLSSTFMPLWEVKNSL